MGITYYVSATEGNNNNPGNQPAKPLRTIQAAINKVQAGDTITVRGGTYGERLHIQKPGTIDAPIIITAQQGETPIIDGSSLNIPQSSALVVVLQSQDIRLVGLTIRNSGGIGMTIHKSSRITVQGVTIDSSFAGGLHITNSDILVVEGCHIHNCARRFLAYGPERQNVALLTRRSKDITIKGNKVYENSDEGIAISLGSNKVLVSNNTCFDNRNGQISVTSAIDVIVDSNLCYHTGRSGYLTLNEQRSPGITKADLTRYAHKGRWHSRDIRICNNIVVGCGVGFQAGYEGGKLSRVQVSHNTIVNSTQHSIHLALPMPSTQSYIENNLIASNNEDAELIHAMGGNGIVWRHNLWSSFPGDQVFNPSSDVVEAEIGLANINAPINAGSMTAEPYKLVGTSVAINRGIAHDSVSQRDFWGAARDSRPDIGASEYPGGNSEPPELTTTLPPAGTRVTEGILALYEFLEGQGNEIRDTSGVNDALNLRIKDVNKVTWSDEGLRLNSQTLITSERPATKIINACRSSNEITLEAWINPANTTQDGPARVISLSDSKFQRNFTLGQGLHGNQPTDLFMVRLRTTQTSANGLPAVISPTGSATNNITHVTYTRQADGRATLYINGQDRGVLNIGGDFSNWGEQMPLLLANELSEDRGWLGTFRLAAIYSRALASEEVLHNYEAAAGNENPVMAEFSISPDDEYGVTPHVVEFDSSASFAEAGIASYYWEFGDGQTSTQANPTNTYTTPGIFTVSLTITDNNNQTDKITKENLITAVDTPIPPIPADFARFTVINVSNSKVLAFGIKYPDQRCALMWNEEPNHLLMYASVDDVSEGFTDGKTIEIVWIDRLEEE